MLEWLPQLPNDQWLVFVSGSIIYVTVYVFVGLIMIFPVPCLCLLRWTAINQMALKNGCHYK